MRRFSRQDDALLHDRVIPPYGSDSFLRFQLRHKIRVLKEDDQRILWESGIGSLTKMELREACQERGMRSTGLSKDAYKSALQQWLDLSVHKDVPIALLIMSRTFYLRDDVFESNKGDDESTSLAGLADAISGLDKEVVNEVILNAATSEEKRADPDVRKIKLEVLSAQNELIRLEEEAREAAKKIETKEKQEAKEAAAAAAAEKVEKLEATDQSMASTTKVLPEKPPTTVEVEGMEDAEVLKEELDLSPHEMDAISQLVSEDPVSKERAELQKIKAAMKKKKEASDEKEDASKAEKLSTDSVIEPAEIPSSPEPLTSEEADQIAASTVEKLDQQAEKESASSTEVTFETEANSTATTPGTVEDAADKHDDGELEEEEEDPVVARLKRKVASMVDKIEVQLSETEVKIGDKLHFLDKDRDGILSPEEMAEVLMQVLKRNITMEEALEIANEMVCGDDDRDSEYVFSGLTHTLLLV